MRGNIQQGWHIDGEPRIFASFRKETEIKARLWPHLNSLQIQAKSSNPPKFLAGPGDWATLPSSGNNMF